MSKWRWIAGLLALSPACALAQQAPPATEPEDSVTITGRSEDRRAREFVEALASPSRNRQLARFEDGICPKSFGVIEEARFAARMRRVAAAADLPVAKEACRPNVVVLLVKDRKAAIEHWRVKRPDFFHGMTQRQIRELAEGEGPTAAWQIVHVKGTGRRAIGQANSDHYDYLVIPESTPSRLESPIQLEFFASFLLVEAPALGDASLTQLADYAAMRTFARTDPAAAALQSTPTILSLFERDGRAVPLSVTDWDMSYLRALYDTRIAARGYDQQREMVRAVRNDAGRANE